MAVRQTWTVTVEDQTSVVEYRYSKLSGKTVLIVDGASFTVKGKPFGIGVVRREPIMVCGVQGMLDVGKGGRAKLIVREGEVK